MGEVTSMGEVHAEDGVPRPNCGKVNGHVRLGSRVRLHIDVFGAEHCLGACDGQLFNLVHGFASRIISSAGIPLGILVGHDGAHRLKNRRTYVIFRGDEDQAILLPFNFLHDREMGFGVFLLKPAHGARFLSWVHSVVRDLFRDFPVRSRRFSQFFGHGALLQMRRKGRCRARKRRLWQPFPGLQRQ